MAEKKKWSDFKEKKVERKEVFKSKSEERRIDIQKEIDVPGMDTSLDLAKEFKEEIVSDLVEEPKVETAGIKQLALNNQLVRTYVSLEEAVKHTGYTKNQIEDACNGVDSHIFAAFKWMFI